MRCHLASLKIFDHALFVKIIISRPRCLMRCHLASLKIFFPPLFFIFSNPWPLTKTFDYSDSSNICLWYPKFLGSITLTHSEWRYSCGRPVLKIFPWENNDWYWIWHLLLIVINKEISDQRDMTGYSVSHFKTNLALYYLKQGGGAVHNINYNVFT